MFLKNLKIYKQGYESEPIQDIDFKIGLNIISDKKDEQDGNGIGKTTVLKAIDFCLGGDLNIIYTDPENKNNVNQKVKDFLAINHITAKLTLTADGNFNNQNAKAIMIERRFLAGTKQQIKVNGEPVQAKDFTNYLGNLMLDLKTEKKPTFKQVIAHSIRYKNERIENCLKILGGPSNQQAVYESLYLYMLFGNEIYKYNGDSNKNLEMQQLKALDNALKLILNGDNLNQLETQLKLNSQRISEVQEKVDVIKFNDNYQEDIDNLSLLNSEINQEIQKLEGLKYRKSLIEKNLEALKSNVFEEDEQKLKLLYEEFVSMFNMGASHDVFENLVNYHNSMNENKAIFLEKDLVELNQKVEKSTQWINTFQAEIKQLETKFNSSLSFEDYERLTLELNNLHEDKGSLETRIKEISRIEGEIAILKNALDNSGLYSEEFEKKLKARVEAFNDYFTEVSKELYDESYYISHELKETKNGIKYYEFKNHSYSYSSGDKQGEALCFDIAYCGFAQEYNIPHLKFLLNDKKELLDSTKIYKVKSIAEKYNVQLVFSMLSDKLLRHEDLKEYIRLELSKEKKFFKF